MGSLPRAAELWNIPAVLYCSALATRAESTDTKLLEGRRCPLVQLHHAMVTPCRLFKAYDGTEATSVNIPTNDPRQQLLCHDEDTNVPTFSSLLFSLCFSLCLSDLPSLFFSFSLSLCFFSECSLAHRGSKVKCRRSNTQKRVISKAPIIM